VKPMWRSIYIDTNFRVYNGNFINAYFEITLVLGPVRCDPLQILYIIACIYTYKPVIYNARGHRYPLYSFSRERGFVLYIYIFRPYIYIHVDSLYIFMLYFIFDHSAIRKSGPSSRTIGLVHF